LAWINGAVIAHELAQNEHILRTPDTIHRSHMCTLTSNLTSTFNRHNGHASYGSLTRNN
jgi:hypothetical protein